MLAQENMDVQAIVDGTYGMFEQYKDVSNVEVEIRLGRKNGTYFDTNVGAETFNRLMEGLRQYDGWESQRASTTDVYYNDQYGIRITVDGESGRQLMVQKVSVSKQDFTQPGAPLDVRVAKHGDTGHRTVRDGSKENQTARVVRAQRVVHRHDDLTRGRVRSRHG